MALLIIPVLKGDRELEVRTATYGSEIDQSQLAKSVSHTIIFLYCIRGVFAPPYSCKVVFFHAMADYEIMEKFFVFLKTVSFMLNT